MKNIKKYEAFFNSQDRPEIDDYVICRENIADSNLKHFLNTSIGQIIDINNNRTNYIVKYDDVPSELSELFNYGHNIPNCRSMIRYEIIEFDKNKEALIAKSNKYNI
jgi:hypothetical protein